MKYFLFSFIWMQKIGSWTSYMQNLRSENILIPKQRAFRNNRSADHPITLKNEIDAISRNKQHVIAIAFDIEEAFITTLQYNIVRIVKEIGLEGNIINFIKNFLQNIKFRIKANGKLSETKKSRKRFSTKLYYQPNVIPNCNNQNNTKYTKIC